ncbi:MAG: reverse transcriptase family protein, partial [Candidatus Thiodiazotropha taylori]|nr:reverse transcriptase family protein [Candidatus Thiodiazotropha taylori]MCW4336782.1 reverse transcriptase family protein [Candidatus Thiodiazotropha endolucinida]
GQVPSEWRRALIVPLFKKGLKHLPSNYRPVSLTSMACKVLEHIIHSNIMRHFDENDILTVKQHGFRKRRSCVTQLATTIQGIASKLRAGRDQVDVVLLDFAKAFDKVPHRRLLYKLSYYGVRGQTLQWVEAFLGQRTQQVLLDGSCSSQADVISGVPQGTVLGPLLFLAFINDLPEAVNHSDPRLFADDCLLFRLVRTEDDARKLQEDLDALEEWETKWQMKFHPEKCQVIRINLNKRFESQSSYSLHGHKLEVVDSAKYLGVHLSNDLTWHKHVDATVAKASKTLGFLRRNLSECTKPVKSAAYTTLVRPILEYSSPVWDPSSVEDISKLEKVQKQAARFAHGNYHDRTPGCVSKMVSDLGWEPLQQRRQADRLTTLFKIQRGLVETDAGDVLRPNDRRTRGQQRLYQPAATVSVYKNSFFPRTIKEWNLLPTNITDAATLEEFRVGLGAVLPTLQP